MKIFWVLDCEFWIGGTHASVFSRALLDQFFQSKIQNPQSKIG